MNNILTSWTGVCAYVVVNVEMLHFFLHPVRVEVMFTWAICVIVFICLCLVHFCEYY